MNARFDPIALVTQRGTDALVKELGVVNTMRFLGQFREGNGDYTAQREHLFQGMSVAEMAREIRAKKAGN
ncbi:MAG: hypothetical protein ACKOF9_17460 [Burkholderiales bacterium]